MVGKDGLKNEQFKEGATVTVLADDQNKVTAAKIGNGGGKKEGKYLAEQTALGKVKKVDDATKVIIFSGDERQEFTGKAGLKNEQVKEGAVVFLVTAGETKGTPNNYFALLYVAYRRLCGLIV